jgi:hypothetical protein
MQSRTVPTASSKSTPANRLRIVAAIALASLVGAGLLVFSLRTSAGTAAAQLLSCSPRLVVVDNSSETRSPELASLTQAIVEEAAQSAVVCDSNLSAFAVSGGGLVTPIVTTDNLAAYSPMGPNAEIRSTRFDSAERTSLDNFVVTQLRRAYKSGDASITSMSALYQLASEQSSAETAVVFISTGVNHDAVVNLDQPLAKGQGVSLARRITVPRVAAHEITIVGLAQVDSSLPPPSAEWPSQVVTFNAALCEASRAPHCRMFELASPSQALST